MHYIYSVLSLNLSGIFVAQTIRFISTEFLTKLHAKVVCIILYNPFATYSVRMFTPLNVNARELKNGIATGLVNSLICYSRSQLYFLFA